MVRALSRPALPVPSSFQISVHRGVHREYALLLLRKETNIRRSLLLMMNPFRSSICACGNESLAPDEEALEEMLVLEATAMVKARLVDSRRPLARGSR